jgi:hypothetical protein
MAGPPHVTISSAIASEKVAIDFVFLGHSLFIVSKDLSRRGHRIQVFLQRTDDYHAVTVGDTVNGYRVWNCRGHLSLRYNPHLHVEIWIAIMGNTPYGLGCCMRIGSKNKESCTSKGTG